MNNDDSEIGKTMECPKRVCFHLLRHVNLGDIMIIWIRKTERTTKIKLFMDSYRTLTLITHE